MNDSLSLPLRQGPAGIRALTAWESMWLPLGEGESLGLPSGRGEGWQPQPVPRQEAASEGRQALWYRAAFNRPDHPGRVLLRFGGAFLAANVWFNGRLLGSHYGYFGPFGFDVSPFLRPDNLLVVCCESPVEKDFIAKKHVMGVFAEGDSRPYPSSAYFGLPENYEWEVPIGLWRPVELEYVGAVHLDWMRLTPRLEAGDVGVVDIEARLRNLDGREMAGVVGFEVQCPGGVPVRLVRDFRLPGGLEQTLNLTFTVPSARRWMPWRLGNPTLYEVTATVLVDGRLSTQVKESFGFRDLEVRPNHSGWSVRVNGQRMFLRGANYQPAYQLDNAGEELFRGDLRLAREANLDALRVHGHVLPEEFYRCADQEGMLVLADFPLTGSYAYHASAEEARFFESGVREQVPEMVELLRNRASIVLWSAHDNPPWLAANADMGDVHVVRQNYTIDQEIKGLLERLDPTRPAVAASGELDAHAYLGWYEGCWDEFADAEPPLVTEYGCPAPPDENSTVWRQLRSRWPVRDDEPEWLYAGFDPVRADEVGLGLPSDYPSLAAWIEASQRYQAWLVGYAAEQLRKRKFQPCWGAFVYQFVDSFPGFGFGVLDASRRPKLAYEALRHAMAPTRILIDPVAFQARSPFGITYGTRAPANIRLVAVNDDPAVSGPARLRWTLYRDRLGSGSLGWLRDAARKRSYTGSVEFQLPAWSDPAALVTTLSLPLRSEGEYRLVVELFVRSRHFDTAELDFDVGVADAATDVLRPLPRYVADRLVAPQSLQNEPDGFTVEFLNRARPAYLAAIDQLAVDGVVVRDLRLSVVGPTGRSSLPRRLELPMDRPVKLHVETGQPLTRGAHVVDMDVRVPGVACGRVRVQGEVALDELLQSPARGSA